MSRRRNKTSPVGLIVLIMLLALLAVLVVLRVTSQNRAFQTGPDPSTAPSAEPVGSPVPTATPYEEILESGVIIRPLQTPTPEPGTTPAPTPTPAASNQNPSGAVIIENQGDLEILLPEDMESDGF